jgi:TIR domain/Caspase domain
MSIPLTQSLEMTRSEEPPRRIALLICNGIFPKVPEAQLTGPLKDAENLGAALSDPEACRFVVRTLLDKCLVEVRRQIAFVCRDAREQDTLLIYYSGNGLKGEGGSLCLLVADSERDCPDATALDSDFILSELRRSRCRKLVLLIDVCHAGAFFAQNRGIPNGLSAITSCGADELCADTPKGGAFTLAICSALKCGAADSDGDGQVSVDDLYEFAKGSLRSGGYSWTPQKWVWNVPEPIYIASVPRPIFLSYAREDISAADELLKALETEGIPVWIDRDKIRSGSWKERVTEGLNRSRCVIALLTPNSLRSTAVRKELAFASKKGVPIVPVELSEIGDESLPDWYTLDYDELHRHLLLPEAYSAGTKNLAEAVRALKPKRSEASPAEAG